MTTAIVDQKRRVRIPTAKPGQVFAIEQGPDGMVHLVPLAPQEPKQAKVRFHKRGRFTVGIVDRPIDEAALKQALEEFP